MSDEPITVTVSVAAATPDPRLRPDESLLIATLAPGSLMSEFQDDLGGWVVQQPGKKPELLSINGLEPFPLIRSSEPTTATVTIGPAQSTTLSR